jgi:hypothetical protein
MKLFKCQSCGNLVYFENTTCEMCSHRLGFLPGAQIITALEPLDEGWTALEPPGGTFRQCDNAQYEVCNWLIGGDQPAGRLCVACEHNHTIPDVNEPEHFAAWRKIEIAKHQLFYQLLRLDLPMPTRDENPEGGLAFDFLAEPADPKAPHVMTGHDNGLITLALKEADDIERTKLREAMGEPYRTLLGHFRHEIGHFYWDQLVRDGGQLAACRAVFGDDSLDYEAALKKHYAEGVPANWQEHFISAYATTHPWEDFAETWAHYLHIVDTLETARAFGIRVRPRVTDDPELMAEIDFDAYHAKDARTLVDNWLPLTFAVNSLNRSMGQPDLYPFILSEPVVAKLEFIHQLVQGKLPVAQKAAA